MSINKLFLKGFAVFLVFTILFTGLVSCGNKSDSLLNDNSYVTDIDAKAILVDVYGLEDSVELHLDNKKKYSDEVATYFKQAYKGVEIYDSCLLVVSGKENYTIGTYYDLENAFTDDFDALLKEAHQIPAWMNSESEIVNIDVASNHPVIYITDSDEAILCRSFLAEINANDVSGTFEIVMDLDDQHIFSIRNTEYFNGYQDCEINNVMISKENDTYYAYNSEYNFFVANSIFEDTEEIKVKDFETYRNGTWEVKDSTELIYSTKSDQWDKTDEKKVLKAADAYYDVLKWYDDKFDYHCIDGNGGRSVLFLCDEVGGTAMNINSVSVALTSDVTNSLDVLTHEVAHSVFQYSLCRTGGTENETAALNEAIADVFACLYRYDDSWNVGQGLSSGKNRDIASTVRTMDDYRYDRYAVSSEGGDGIYESILTVGDYISYIVDKDNSSGLYDPIYSKSSTKSRYYNSFIISHTMYEIWNEVFQRNNDAFMKIFYHSLRYLTHNPDFSDFRDAFLYAMNQTYNTDKVRWTSTFFDVAKIYSNDKENLKKICYPPKDTFFSLYEMMDLNCEELSNLKWDSFQQVGSDEYTFFYEASYDDVKYRFSAYCEDIQPEEAKPDFLEIYNDNEGGTILAISDSISLGMTKDELEGLICNWSVFNYDYYDAIGSVVLDENAQIDLLFREIDGVYTVIGAQIDNFNS